MSSAHAQLVMREGRWRALDAGSKNGTFVDGAPCSDTSLKDEAVIECGRTVFHFRRHAPGAGGDEREADPDDPLETFCPQLRGELDRLSRLAGSNVTVLLLGDTGTGKEVAARAVHALSARPGQFVGVNCGALPPALVESELFGHVRGAFSGADADRDGLVQAADGGTLFLDEIAELAPAAQVALLRALQEREVRRVGSSAAAAVDVRVIAATLRDLPAELDSGAFREDLYARIAGVVVRLPPLRRRREDLGIIIAGLLRRAGADASVRVDRLAAQALFAHPWPRNIRELDSALRTALALCGDSVIALEHLPADVRAVPAAPASSAPPQELGPEDRALRARLVDLLTEHRGNVAAVARAVGKAPMQVYRWIAPARRGRCRVSLVSRGAVT